MEFKKKVSIVIPVYDRAVFLDQAIRSALEQDYPSKEVILVDDGAHDNISEKIGPYGSSVRYIRQHNKGQGGARNTGIKAAEGDYIQFLDQDDVLFQNKLQIQVPILDENPGVDVVYGKAVFLRENSDGSFQEKPDTFTNVLVGNLFEHLVKSNFIWLQTCLFRKRTLEQILGFSEDRALIGVDDWDLLLRLSLNNYFFRGIDQPFIYYRFHSKSFSQENPDRMRLGCITVLEGLLKNQKAVISVKKKKRILNALATQRYYYARSLFAKNEGSKARIEMLKGLASFDTLWFVKLMGLVMSLIRTKTYNVNHDLDRFEQFFKSLKGKL